MSKLLELNCAEYRVTSASAGHRHGGSVFSCTLSPVTDETLKALDAAAVSDRRVRLNFPKQPLVLESIVLVRIGRGRVRIAGRVVDPALEFRAPGGPGTDEPR